MRTPTDGYTLDITTVALSEYGEDEKFGCSSGVREQATPL